MFGWLDKNNPVTQLRRDIRAAADAGNVDALQRLLSGDIDLPQGVLDNALERAVSRQQIRVAGTLLAHGAKPQNIGMGTARTVVQEERMDAFRLLSVHGMDFSRYSAGENDGVFKLRLRYLQKCLECEALQHEITKWQAGSPEEKSEPRPAAVPRPPRQP